MHYLSSAFGGTPPLFGFWRRAGFAPVYLRQQPSDLTGEHTIIMLRELSGGGCGPDPPPPGWTEPFVADFRRRAAALLSGPCRELAPGLALGLLSPRLSFSEAEVAAALAAAADPGSPPPVTHADGTPLTPHDRARLGAYAAALADAALVGDLVPALAAAWVGGRLPISLSPAQAALLVCVGLQRASPAAAAGRLGLPAHQAMALFNKAIRRLHAHLAAVEAAGAGRDLAPAPPRGGNAAAAASLPRPDPAAPGLDEELDAAAAEAAAVAAAEVATALGGRDGLARFAVDLPADLPCDSDGRGLASGALLSVRADPAAKAAAAAATTAAATPSTAMYKRGGDKKKKSKGGGGGGSGGGHKRRARGE